MKKKTGLKKRGFLGLLLFLTLILYHIYDIPDTHAARTSNIEEVTLHIDGMHCASCPATVKLAITGVKGVIDASVSYKEEKAVVHYVKNKVDVKEIIKAIEDAGYGAKILSGK